MKDIYDLLCDVLLRAQTVEQAEFVADRAGQFAERYLQLQDLARRRMDQLPASVETPRRMS